MDPLEIVERRARPRVEAKVRVRLEGEGGSETYTGNLSKNGIFMETTIPFAEINEKVQLRVSLPIGADSVKVTGKVVRIAKPNQLGITAGVGIHFLRIEARQAKTFDRFIDKLLESKGIGSRRFRRVKMQAFVELKSNAQIRQVISDNLSSGGVFLKTALDGFTLGQSISVILVHPKTKRKFSIEGEVVHIRRGESALREDFIEGVGVAFHDVSSQRREDMSSFLKGILAKR